MEKEEKISKEPIAEDYVPSEKAVSVINRVVERFDKMQEERDKPRREFDGRTLKEYIKDSVDAYNGIVPEEIRETKEAWQSLIFDQKTRGKVKAVVAMVAAGRPFVNLTGKTEADDEYSEDMRLTYEDAWKNENGNYKNYEKILDACMKGTIIVEEGYQEIKKKEKTIISVNQETGKVKYKEKEVIEGGAGSVFSKIIPLEYVYLNENYADVKSDIIIMDYLDQANFDKQYGGYEEAKYVKTGVLYSNIADIKYKSVTDDPKNIIEIMKYYNEDLDELIILANGVWLNPQEEDSVCPIPFNHKKLPFVKTVFELADVNLPYGKSLADIMAGEQETINALLRMTVDQEVLSIHKPIFLGQGAELESYQMFPGKSFRVNGDIDQIREMEISGTQNSTFQTLEWLDKKSDVNTAVDANAMGVHSGQKTAKEATLLDENTKRLSGTFQTFIYKMLKECAILRISNICQFYKDPLQTVALKDRFGKEIKDRNGVSIKKDKFREFPVESEGKKPFWVTIKPEMCKAKYFVNLEEDIEPSMSRQERLTIAERMLEESKNNPLISADEATIGFIKALGKSIKRFYIAPSQDEMKASINGQLPPKEGAVNQQSAGFPAVTQ